MPADHSEDEDEEVTRINGHGRTEDQEEVKADWGGEIRNIDVGVLLIASNFTTSGERKYEIGLFCHLFFS